MRIFETIQEVIACGAIDMGCSDWLLIDQARINDFARATGDMEWLHVDEERAQAGPFGGTVAHGFLSLSLIPVLRDQIFQIRTPGAQLNYGLNRVRFPTPLPVNSRVRATARIVELTLAERGLLLNTEYRIEIEGHAKPACLAEMLVLIT